MAPAKGMQMAERAACVRRAAVARSSIGTQYGQHAPRYLIRTWVLSSFLPCRAKPPTCRVATAPAGGDPSPRGAGAKSRPLLGRTAARSTASTLASLRAGRRGATPLPFGQRARRPLGDASAGQTNEEGLSAPSQKMSSSEAKNARTRRVHTGERGGAGLDRDAQTRKEGETPLKAPSELVDACGAKGVGVPCEVATGVRGRHPPGTSRVPCPAKGETKLRQT